MNRTICYHVVGVWFALFASCPAQEPKTPAKPAESKEVSAAADVESAAEVELSNRRWRDEAQALLRKPTDVEFDEVALEEVVKFLADFHNARIRLDRTALNAQQSLTPITISAVGQPLSHVLDRIMQAPDLAWTVHRGDIVITTLKALPAVETIGGGHRRAGRLRISWWLFGGADSRLRVRPAHAGIVDAARIVRRRTLDEQRWRRRDAIAVR
ncbi:MAG: hypothetical protein FD138_3928 [Planctomycetota bacterium]|nr:MAG: hypothetical protein FD138_3928 [Planctomycetota bacterium]